MRSKTKRLQAQVVLLREAIRLTREYVSEPTLPALEGWTWFDAIVATGGLQGFGGCGCVLNPRDFGRSSSGGLRSCTLDAGHDGDHGRRPEPPPSRQKMTAAVAGDFGCLQETQ